MKLLLDTHTLLWAISSPEFLDVHASKEIASSDNAVFVSLASLWELQIKVSLGKVELPHDFHPRLIAAGFEPLLIRLQHIEALAKLPLIHRDPFDRMLVSQAKCEDLTLVTRDDEMLRYPLKFLRA